MTGKCCRQNWVLWVCGKWFGALLFFLSRYDVEDLSRSGTAVGSGLGSAWLELDCRGRAERRSRSLHLPMDCRLHMDATQDIGTN